MGAREDILAAVRACAVPQRPHPELTGVGLECADPAARFAESVVVVGGRAVRVPDRPALSAAILALPERIAAKRVVSLVPGAGDPNVDLAKIDDPHQLEGIDLAIVPGELGVAENGAVWVTGASLPHRATFVIAEHLVLVIEAAKIVKDMHEAYARLSFSGLDYGLFISGPSKTADIEQALVVGAHGARSCTVLVVG